MLTKEDILYIFVFLIASTAIFLSIYIGYGDYHCQKTAELLNYKCNYLPFYGCVLEKPNGERILYHKLRFIEK